jgi:hypothetical protein
LATRIKYHHKKVCHRWLLAPDTNLAVKQDMNDGVASASCCI